MMFSSLRRKIANYYSLDWLSVWSTRFWLANTETFVKIISQNSRKFYSFFLDRWVLYLFLYEYFFVWLIYIYVLLVMVLKISFCIFSIMNWRFWFIVFSWISNLLEIESTFFIYDPEYFYISFFLLPTQACIWM